MRLGKSVAMAAAVCIAASSLTAPTFAASIRDKTEKAKAEIPTCSHRIGTIAVREPDNKWWQGLGLESPEALIKLFVQRSGCFTLVDRGKGFEMAQQERALAAGGGLQGGSNISICSKTAEVILSLTNVRTSEQLAMAEGLGDLTDIGFGVGGGGFGGG